MDGLKKHRFNERPAVGGLLVCDVCELIQTPLVVARGCSGKDQGLNRWQEPAWENLMDKRSRKFKRMLDEVGKLREEYNQSAQGGRSSY